MTVNVGTLDRVLRAVLGVVLIYLALTGAVALLSGPVMTYLTLAVGLVMLGVAVFRVCPVYTVLGIRTCRSA